MRTITKKVDVYSFAELSESAKESAIMHLRDINVDHDWWDGVYDDASDIGLTIRSFDIGRRWEINGTCDTDVITMLRRILRIHGPDCETFKTAKNLLDEWQKTKRTMDQWAREDWQDDARKSILEDYLQILSDECEYLQSDEAIVETIEANEYEFTEDGRLH